MFNLLMKGAWVSGPETFNLGRMFEYTRDHIQAKFKRDGRLQLEELMKLPCLFMDEGTGDQIAHVGRISGLREAGRELHFRCEFDPEVPTLRNSQIYERQIDFDMPNDFEFSRNHWAVKEVDLYQMLLRIGRPRRQLPTVFRIADPEAIDREMLSVMMPFAPQFDSVYAAIGEVAQECGLTCRRADDIWDEDAVIQEVVNLIDSSRIVVCDLSTKNANVFYEVGIAHTLGRPVIIIAQSADDVPFDLRHLRYVTYHNNGEGREALKARLKSRLEHLVER